MPGADPGELLGKPCLSQQAARDVDVPGTLPHPETLASVLPLEPTGPGKQTKDSLHSRCIATTTTTIIIIIIITIIIIIIIIIIVVGIIIVIVIVIVGIIIITGASPGRHPSGCPLRTAARRGTPPGRLTPELPGLHNPIRAEIARMLLAGLCKHAQ